MFVLLCLTLAVVIAVRACRKATPETRAEVKRLARNVRLAAGSDRLKLIMEHMLDQMRDSRVKGVHRFYVPNDMSFGVHPDDFARWGQYADRIADELVEMLAHEIKLNRWTVAGDGNLRVRIGKDDQARPGRPTFKASIRTGRLEPIDNGERTPRDRHAPGATVRLESARTVPDVRQGKPVPSTSAWRLEISGRPAINLGSELLVGRSRGCRLRLSDPRVSGQHARFAMVAGNVTLIDLASTNGTFVNGRRIDSATLHEGDTIRFGSTQAAILRAL
jgi:hypothetical protein